jgi:hypothetical protein
MSNQHKRVLVLDSDRTTVLGYVSTLATSIGANRVAGGRRCSWEQVEGAFCWVVTPQGGRP